MVSQASDGAPVDLASTEASSREIAKKNKPSIAEINKWAPPFLGGSIPPLLEHFETGPPGLVWYIHIVVDNSFIYDTNIDHEIPR